MTTPDSVEVPVSPQKHSLAWPVWVGRLLLLVMPLLSLTLVEALNYNNPWTDFTPVQIVLNLAWYYLGEAFLYLLFRRRISSIRWGVALAWVFGCINHYLISFRGRTLFPGDLLTLGTAINVAGNYNYKPDRTQIITFLVMLIAILLASMLPPGEERHPVSKKWIPAAVLCVGYLGVFFGTGLVEACEIEPSMWTTRENGLILNFTVCLKYMRVQKPQGYARQLSDLTETPPSDPAPTTQPVNLIVIMNESFADLSVLPGVESNKDAMPFLRELQENTVKGYAYTSVFGGTTANSEYEFLTGNTTAFLPAGTVPYQMYVSDGDPSLVGQLKTLGYRCIASHPYRSSGWNRPAVYRDFGFDEIYFERDFQNRTYMRGDAKSGYVSDRCDFENLIRMYEEKEPGEPLFLFNVTMQNHSAYRMPWTNLSEEVWLTGDLEGRFSTVNQYLSLIYETDRAFEDLVGYFAGVEEPTMILMFGDHQPQVATNFYTDVLGDSPDLALAQRKQMTPFVLWANYDIPEQDNVALSLNYLSALLVDTAGLPLTGYQQFLQTLHQDFPVINAVGIQDRSGTWYEASALPEALQTRLREYQIVQYNSIFDKRNRVEPFFQLSAQKGTDR